MGDGSQSNQADTTGGYLRRWGWWHCGRQSTSWRFVEESCVQLSAQYSQYLWRALAMHVREISDDTLSPLFL
jgi:hypothetical protein